MSSDQFPESYENDRELPENGNEPSLEYSGEQAKPFAGGPEPSNPQKKSRVSFLLLFMSFTGFLVICAGLFYAYRFIPHVTYDPEEVKVIKNEIANLELPEGPTDQAAITTDNYLFELKMVIYGYENPSSRLVLLTSKSKQPETREQVREMINDFIMQMGLIPIKQESLEGQEIVIDGKPEEYEFKQGIDAVEGTDKFMIRGPIPYSENEDAELIYLSPTEKDLLNGVKMIQNLKPAKE